MKTIARDELYQHVDDFLKARGIELKDGTYANRIRQSCHLLADAINATQKTLAKARGEVDEKLQRLRKSVHRATAPKPPVMETEPVPAPEPEESLRRRPAGPAKAKSRPRRHGPRPPRPAAKRKAVRRPRTPREK